MIDTTTTIESILQPKPLKLISIDFDNLVNNNLSIMENFLRANFKPQIDFYNSLSEFHNSLSIMEDSLGVNFKQKNVSYSDPILFKDAKIGINRHTEIIIKSWDDIGYDDSYFGFNDNIRILKGNLTITEWAQKILEHYCIWLKKQYQKQSKMSPLDLKCLLQTERGTAQALFDADSYTDWVISQLDSINDGISYKFLQLDDAALLMEKLLVKLNNITYINSSTLETLITIMNEDSFTLYSDTPTYRVLLKQLCNLLLQQENKHIKVKTDSLINYQLTIETLYEEQLMTKANKPITIELPISGICDIDMNNIYALNHDYNIQDTKNAVLNIKLTVKQPNSIDLFIENLLLIILNNNYNVFLENFKKALLYFKISKVQLPNYQQILDSAIQKQAKAYNTTNVSRTKMYYIFNLLFTNAEK